ncbi:MAG TPA: YpdA family putative bacillithiol disulfide reductase [Vicinamibacterales bacterium]|nr:YpdA family putative bacillithiol disulfide reductase [Vicinamibacterales bacterium]
MTVRDVIVIGAGPAGLATAIAASRRGLSYLVVEKGALVNSLLHYPTEMIFFTTPELMEIGGLPFVSPYEKPTRLEALRYYRRVTDALALEIVFDEAVVAVTREDGVPDSAGSFVVDTHSARGVRRSVRGRTVVIATGAYDVPNLLDIPGEDLPHVSHYYTQPHPFFRKRVVVVGGKNSAAEAALDLYRAGARVTLVHRGAALSDSIKYWVKPDIENRLREGTIEGRLETRVLEIRPTTVVVERAQVVSELPADAVFLLTGYRSDSQLLRAAGVRIDPDTCGPVFDGTTFETSVPGLYVAGAVVAGVQSGKIFIENGRFHGEQVIQAVARRLGAPAGAATPVS